MKYLSEDCIIASDKKENKYIIWKENCSEKSNLDKLKKELENKNMIEFEIEIFKKIIIIFKNITNEIKIYYNLFNLNFEAKRYHKIKYSVPIKENNIDFKKLYNIGLFNPIYIYNIIRYHKKAKTIKIYFKEKEYPILIKIDNINYIIAPRIEL